MTDQSDAGRTERDRNRSDEARWRVAEAGAQAEKDDELADARRRVREEQRQENDWDNGGGSTEREL